MRTITAAQFRLTESQRNKYGAKPQVIDGIRFASKREANRFLLLRLSQRQGLITGLVPHPQFPLIVNGRHVAYYTADSTYYRDGKKVVEDVKSPSTARNEAYRLRSKLFQALYPDIIFVEVQA